MRVVVASKVAGIGCPRIRDGVCSFRRDDVDIKVDEPLSGDGGVIPAHAVSGVTDRTREAVVDVPGVLGEASVGEDLRQIVALRAHRVGTIHAEIGARIEIGDKQPGARSLAELITAFKQVCPLGSMRTIRPAAAKLAIVVAVVAVGAKNLRPHVAPLRNAVQIQRVGQQAGL